MNLVSDFEDYLQAIEDDFVSIKIRPYTGEDFSYLIKHEPRKIVVVRRSFFTATGLSGEDNIHAIHLVYVPVGDLNLLPDDQRRLWKSFGGFVETKINNFTKNGKHKLTSMSF